MWTHSSIAALVKLRGLFGGCAPQTFHSGPLPPKPELGGSHDMGDCAAMTASPTGSEKMPKQETSEVDAKMCVNQAVWQRLPHYVSL